MSDELMTPLDPIAGSPGFYKTRKVRHGAFIPARLWTEETRDEDGHLIADVRYCAEIGLEPVDAYDPPGWPWVRITESAWRYLRADLEYCLKHERDRPIANPHKPAGAAPREVW